MNAITQTIHIPLPDAPGRLRILAGACRLRIAAGGGDAWVEGSYQDPAGVLTPLVEPAGAGDATLRLTPEGADAFNLFGGVPTVELTLGGRRPYALVLEAGATEADLELGGLPLRRLAVKLGAGRLSLDLAAPNPVEMELLEVSAGAAAVELTHLANAGFAELRLEGGAASYRLELGGPPRRDARARIKVGLASVELLVPAAGAVRVAVEPVLAGLEVGDGWTKAAGAYCTPAALAGGGPVLTVEASVALGSLALRLG